MRSLDRGLSAGKIGEEEHRAAIGRLRFTTDLSELADRELVIEAVPSVEMVRFVNSGTEACMSVLRLMRGAIADEMARCDLFENRVRIVSFDCVGMRPLRRIGETATHENLEIEGLVEIGRGNRGQQGFCVGVARLRKQFCGWRCFHDSA